MSCARKCRQYCWPHGTYHAHSYWSIKPNAPYEILKGETNWLFCTSQYPRDVNFVSSLTRSWAQCSTSWPGTGKWHDRDIKNPQYAERIYRCSHFPGPEKYNKHQTSWILFLATICWYCAFNSQTLQYHFIYNIWLCRLIVVIRTNLISTTGGHKVSEFWRQISTDTAQVWAIK